MTVLRTGLYEGDNGRLLCDNCCGMSARETGFDLSGLPVKRVKIPSAVIWEREFGEPPKCESCKRDWEQINGKTLPVFKWDKQGELR